MHSSHQAFNNTKAFLQQYVDEWRQAVGCARCVRNNVMLGSVVLVVIHANNDSDVFIFRRRGNDDLLSTSFEVTFSFRSFRKETGGLNDDLDA